MSSLKHCLCKESKNAKNQSTTYTYDKLGRITSATDELGTISYTYDANGNVLTVTDENGNVATREYDCMNRVTKYTDFRGNVVKYGYDTLGNLISLEYAGGRIVRYSYYPTGRLKSVTDWNNKVTNYEYDGNGRITKLSRPDGSVETYEYDAIGQLIKQTDINGDRVVNSFTYTYDTAGHIIKTESENVAEETVKAESATMEYDEANRLIKYNGEEVKYDADGNMTYGPLNGEMTTFTYDCRNRLVSAGSTKYEYDAENNRIAVTADNVRTEYVVENNASQYSQILSATTDGKTTLYIYGDGLLAQVDDNNYLYYHFNNIGSTTVVTDDSGEIVHAFTYGTYGELLSGDTHGIMFLYNGRYGVVTDSNGLYYMRARYYNVDIKRFINQDVVEGNITNSPSLNKYAYCQGNPVSMFDPFGLSPKIDWNNDGWVGVSSLLRVIPCVSSISNLSNAADYFSKDNIYDGVCCSVESLPGLINYATAGSSLLGNCATGQNIFHPESKWWEDFGNPTVDFIKNTIDDLHSGFQYIREQIEKIDLTLSIGVNFGASVCDYNAGCAFAISFDTKGNVAFQSTRSGGHSPGTGLSAVGFVTVTNAPNIKKLEGFGGQFGAEFDVAPLIAGGDINVIPDFDNGRVYSGFTFNAGIGSAEIHENIGYTTTLASFNIYDILDSLYYKLMG